MANVQTYDVQRKKKKGLCKLDELDKSTVIVLKSKKQKTKLMLSSPLNGFRYSLAGRKVNVHKNTLTNKIHSQTRTHENNVRGYRRRLKIIQIETN